MINNKYIITLTEPILESGSVTRKIDQTGNFEYSGNGVVKHWEVTYKRWDGFCLCSLEKGLKITLPLTGLSYTLAEIVAEIKKAERN